MLPYILGLAQLVKPKLKKKKSWKVQVLNLLLLLRYVNNIYLSTEGYCSMKSLSKPGRKYAVGGCWKRAVFEIWAHTRYMHAGKYRRCPSMGANWRKKKDLLPKYIILRYHLKWSCSNTELATQIQRYSWKSCISFHFEMIFTKEISFLWHFTVLLCSYIYIWSWELKHTTSCK